MGQQPLHRPGGPSRSSSIAPAETNFTTKFRRARFFGTHAPRDKENQPEMPERKHARDPSAVLARPISLASYPVATGRPRPGHQRPRARVRVSKRLTRGPEINKSKSAPATSPSCGQQPLHRPGGPSRSSSIAPAETIFHNPNFAAPDSSAPTRQGIKRTSPKCRRESTPEPPAVLARPISLASYPVATGRPLPGHQRPRARVRVTRG